ncbi:LTA synthase family protein [Paenibacillus sp. SYP-B3998]|uniref:LTA synthase family protein n=1 Tax=Paenibacillus sp. SYP-B3998 TaxID=2678564 RepID=A0A6G3ZXD6_9BACL|nr:LTA synthase family protein [Paenibacillus sp. SYP-B3998]NEW06249.1 LTA synthase family protein [Paenibacillus sp. SYP-B3998]
MSIYLQILKRLPSRIMIISLPLLLMLMVEWLARGSYQELHKWVVTHPLSMVLAYFVVGSLYLLLIAITGRSRLSFWLLCASLLPLGILSGSKLKAIGAPYYPWDLMFHNRIVEYRVFLNQYWSFGIIALVFGFLLLLAVLFHLILRRHPIRFPWIERMIYAGIAIVMMTSLYTDKPIPFMKMYGLYTVPWDQTITYDENGFLFSSVQMLGFLSVAKPEGYSKKAVTSILNQIPEKKAINEKKPNIIVMLSESFWDPTVMKNVKFSQDPIPFLHDLQKTYTGGWMLSPQFGGSTANVEFEVLSSNSMRFFGKSPDKIIPYIEYMNHGVDSLASITTRQGYSATAINPFFSWFFDSRKVYKHFGFSRFISSEFFPNDFEGPNYADRAVAKKIIEETEKSPGPDFIFANTMENHHPYKPGKFSKNTIEVAGDISVESKGLLETYAQGITDADKCLQMLVDYYSKRSEPTIILFFGDHLPFLEDNYKVYRDADYVLPDDPDLYTKTHNTPFVIWNNFVPKDQEKTNLHLSPSFLGPTLLHLAGIQGSYYTDYLYDLSQKIPVIPPNDMWDKYQIKASDLNDYAKLQYDNLFGSRYGYEAKGYRDTIVQPNYTLGYGDPIIRNVVKVENKLEIEGSNFFSSCSVYVDGVAYKSSFDGMATLYADLPDDSSFDANKAHQIEVRIIDDKKMKIGQSNLYLLPKS